MKSHLSTIGIALLALGVALLALVFFVQPDASNIIMLLALAIELAGAVCWWISLKRESRY